MPNSDHILGFLCAAALHVIGAFVVSTAVTAEDGGETVTSALNTATLELALVEDDAEQPAPAAAGPESEPPEPEPAPELDPEPEPPPPIVLQPDPDPETVILPEPEPEPPLPEPEPELPPTIEAPTEPPPPAADAFARVTETPAEPTTRPDVSAGGGAQGGLVAPTTGDNPIKPIYPVSSRSRGEEGSVVLDVLVSRDGRAKAVTLVASSGFPALDKSAERAVSRARFAPGTRGGIPVEASARLTVIFRLNEG